MKPNYHNYHVTKGGQVWAISPDGRELRPLSKAKGYPEVAVIIDGHRTIRNVARLVLGAYRREGARAESATPINGDPFDCRLVNLKWTPRPKKRKKYTVARRVEAPAVKIPCLRCDKVFTSHGDRLCGKCHVLNEDNHDFSESAGGGPPSHTIFYHQGH